MKLENKHRYTTRSLRSILTWAWNQAKKDLVPAQRAKAQYLEAVIHIHEGRAANIRGKYTLDFPAKAEAKTIAKHALVLWFWRAGMKRPWNMADAIDVSGAPSPAMPTKRKKHVPKKRNRAAADVDKWSQKLDAKGKQIKGIEAELEGLETRYRLLHRRLSKAKKERRGIRSNAKGARERAAEEPTADLDERDYATRMRAKRET